MLRRSARISGVVDLRSVTDPHVPSAMPGGDELLRLADSLVRRASESEIDVAVEAVVGVLGPEATGAAITVVGTFQMMNRTLDATGVASPVEQHSILTEMGLDRTTFGGGRFA